MEYSENNNPLVLVLDDDPVFCTLVRHWLVKDGFRVETYNTVTAFMDALPLVLPDVVCLDIGLPEMSGMDVLPLLRRHHRTVPVIFLTGKKETQMVVKAIQQGAYDYITKPPDRLKLATSLRKAVEWYYMTTRIASLEGGGNRPGYRSIIGQSATMKDVYRQIEKVAHSEIAVLITGESGTGKELVAREIHSNSPRSKGSLITVNCAAITDTLEEAEFFGHEKGAFTGAHQQRPGYIERAHGGILFLDEVAELSLGLQAKLLRVLQEHKFERVGGVKKIDSDFRLVSATHRNLHKLVAAGKFREDLLYRIAVMEIEVPPLRRRGSDLALLIDFCIANFSPDGKPLRLDDRAREALLVYGWPGNVRELQNVIQRAVVIAETEVITLADLPNRLRDAVVGEENAGLPAGVLSGMVDAGSGSSGRGGEGAPPPGGSATGGGGNGSATGMQEWESGGDRSPGPSPGGVVHPNGAGAVVSRDNGESPGNGVPVVAEGELCLLGEMNLAELERWAIKNAMRRKSGNLMEVARQLGISRTTLYRKLKQYEDD